MKHPFLILLIIIQVIVIIYMNQAHNAWMKARTERNHKTIDDIRQLIDDGHGREIGKLWSDSQKQSRPWFEYFHEGIEELREKKALPAAEESSEVPKTEDVPKTEGGERP
ncbi:MAG: hypothetical protein IKP58_04750 [Victivallales bacterium]|nr:hypothetical protein [Victivallales bacterium]